MTGCEPGFPSLPGQKMARRRFCSSANIDLYSYPPECERYSYRVLAQRLGYKRSPILAQSNIRISATATLGAKPQECLQCLSQDVHWAHTCPPVGVEGH